MKKFAAALRSGKISVTTLASEFKKQYGVSLDIESCRSDSGGDTPATSTSSTSSTPTKQKASGEPDLQWIEQQLVKIVSEHDPKNKKGVGKIMKRLRSGKMSFKRVSSQVVLVLFVVLVVDSNIQRMLQHRSRYVAFYCCACGW